MRRQLLEWITATSLAAALLVATMPPGETLADHTLTAAETASLHYISASGSLLNEVGRTTGTLPGSMRVHMLVAATFSGSFTIYTNGGTISGHGTATPHGSGVYESFAGTIVATGGSGRFKHAHGSARLYGTFNRDTYALLMQTSGTLYY